MTSRPNCGNSFPAAVVLLWLAIGATTNGSAFIWVPVSPGGGQGGIGQTDASCTVTGDTVICLSGGVSVQLDVYIANWEVAGSGLHELTGWGALIDAAGSYDNGTGVLAPRDFDGDRQNGAFQVVSTCFQGDSDGIACGHPFDGPFGASQPGVTVADCQADGGLFCAPNADFVHACCNPRFIVNRGLAECLTAADCPYQWYSRSQTLSGALDPGTPRYGGSLVLDIPVGATGTWEIKFRDDSLYTFIDYAENCGIAGCPPVDNLVSAFIVVSAGKCCSVSQGLLTCTDDVPSENCDGAWSEGQFCVGPEAPDPANTDDCCQCPPGDHAACDDVNACTDDSCDGQCGCDHILNYNTSTDCCDPSTGVLTPIDDVDDCTDDFCDPSDGSVSHVTVVNGTSCGEMCMTDGLCEMGICEGVAPPQLPIVGTAGPRSLTIAPQPVTSVAPVALRVTSPDWPCLSKFVGVDGTLVDGPQYQLPFDWGTTMVRGTEIVPGTRYEVYVGCGAEESDPVFVDTCAWGDVNCNGVVSFVDIQLVVWGFQSIFTHATLAEVDIDPCLPNRVINFVDIQRDVHAFQSHSFYGSGCAEPCP